MKISQLTNHYFHQVNSFSTQQISNYIKWNLLLENACTYCKKKLKYEFCWIFVNGIIKMIFLLDCHKIIWFLFQTTQRLHETFDFKTNLHKRNLLKKIKYTKSECGKYGIKSD